MQRVTPSRRQGERGRIALLGALIVIMTLCAIVAVGPTLTSLGWEPVAAPAPAPSTSGPAAAKITMAPRDGTCQQLLMDNKTGRFSNAANVACEGPVLAPLPDSGQDLTNLPQSRYSVGSRTDRIREGFSKR